MKKFQIYTLSHPDDIDNIRYIGYTTQKLHLRLSGHVCKSKEKAGQNYKKEKWVRDILKLTKRPVITLLKECEDCDDMYQSESQFIKEYRSNGFDLFNIECGGNEGYTKDPNRDKEGYKYKKVPVFQYNLRGAFIKEFESSKEAALAVKCSKSLISLCANDKEHTRVGKGFYWRDFYSPQIEVIKPKWGNTGNTHSEDTRAKIGAKSKERKWSQEAIKKRSKTNSKPVLQYDRDRNLVKEWGSAKEVKQELGFRIYSERFGYKFSQHGYHWVFKE